MTNRDDPQPRSGGRIANWWGRLLPDLRRLLTRRTRWGQGAMQCATYIPQPWNSSKIPTIGVLEATYYLLQPWMQIAGTVVYPVPLIIMAWNVTADWTTMSGWFLSGGWMLLLLLVAIGAGREAAAECLSWGLRFDRRCGACSNFASGREVGMGGSCSGRLPLREGHCGLCWTQAGATPQLRMCDRNPPSWTCGISNSSSHA